MEFWGDTDIKTAFVSFFWFDPFCIASLEIVVDRIMKIRKEARRICAFIRDQRTDPHDLAEKQIILF